VNVRVSWVGILLVGACGQPRAPSQEDACRDDEGCSAGLVCCHSTDDTVPAGDRGFCVKRDVCANVVAPAQPPLPASED
jgi:hypothetical protein